MNRTDIGIDAAVRVAGDRNAFVFVGTALTAAVPVGMAVRAVEEALDEGDVWLALNYESMPAWLMLAYAFEAAAFGTMFRAGPDATSLDVVHWILASGAALCALRHCQRMCESPPRQAAASLLAFVVGMLVVAGFRTTASPDSCFAATTTVVIFCAIPAWRLHAAQRAQAAAAGPNAKAARRRCAALVCMMLVLLSLQPYMGVCMEPRPWAESLQMACDLAVLAAATDPLWV